MTIAGVNTPDAIAARLSTLGRRIAELRRGKGMTQDQLSQAVELTEKYLQFIELGRANPTTKVLIRIAIALGVDAAELFAQPTDPAPARPGRPNKNPAQAA